MSLSDEKACFTCVWKIENFSFLEMAKDTMLRSPRFKIKAINNAEWELQLCPKSGLRGKSLRLAARCICTDELQTDAQLLHYDLSVLDADGAVHRIQQIPNAFTKERSNGVCADLIVPRSKIFSSKKDLFLPLDVLTFRCRIWQQGTQPGQCLARTTFYKKDLVWDINFGSSYGKHQFKTFRLASMIFTINLYWMNPPNSRNVKYMFTKIDNGNVECFANCKVRDCMNGRDVALIHDKNCPVTIFDSCVPYCAILHSTIPSSSTSSDYFFSQIWEFTVGVGEVCYELVIQPTPEAPAARYGYSETACDSTLREDLLKLYKEQKCCDATLRTTEQSFPVHKSILCARSEVFRAMFESDMTEGRTGEVDITDVEEDTLSAMLQFLYTDILDDSLEWEAASRMYLAADKYAVLPLKRKCLSILKAELSVSNACDTLVVADALQDDDLMQFVEDFIFDNDEVFCTEKWQSLEENDPRLSTKVFRAMHFKMKKYSCVHA